MNSVDDVVEAVGMAPHVLSVTKEELLAKRARLLEHIGLTREELQSRADSYSLTGEEWDLMTEIKHIEFLLG